MKKRKHLFYLLLVLVIAIAMPYLDTFAEEENNNNYIPEDYVAPRVHNDDAVAVDDSTDAVEFDRGVIPAYYDSRDYFKIPNVKRQYPYGTCWTFSTLAACEVDGIKDGMDSSMDLSELQLAYFTYQRLSDPLNNMVQEGAAINGSTYNYLNLGGNVQWAILSLAKWQGGVDESDLPYVQASITQKYSENLAYNKDSVHLQNSQWINMADVADIKNAIMQYGIVATSYYHLDSAYNDNTYGYYCNTKTTTNHAISLIGWNDNYDKSNFNTKPTHNGAWLVRNSWGSSWGDNGYFWISYEDTSINESNAYTVEIESADNYDNNYQYDGSVITSYYSNTGNYTYSSAANVFHVGSNESIEAVSFVADSAYTDYEVFVYTDLPKNYTSPEDGTLIAKATGSKTYAGYYTVPVTAVAGQSKNLTAGDTYSVIVRCTAKDSTGNYYAPDIPVSASYNYTTYGVDYYDTCNSGESFRRWNNGTWGEIPYNCRVKAFTNELPGEVTSISLDKTRYSGDMGTSFTLKPTVLPASVSNKTVTYKSSNVSVATVNASGVVSIVGDGNAVITARTADGGFTASCNVTGNKVIIDPTGFTFTANVTSIEKGQGFNVTYVPVPSYADVGTVTWTSSNPGVATVNSSGYVNAVAVGSTNITISTKNSKGKAVSSSYTLTVTAATDVHVAYRTHVQREGWQNYVFDGENSGTTGKSYRLEGINIFMSGNSNLGVRYKTHVQTYGWQDWAYDGAMSGTSGESKRLEAIQIELTGSEAGYYDIYYRVHAQTYGWLGWAKNGEASGTAGQSKRLEAVQVIVVKKGAAAPGSTVYRFIDYGGGNPTSTTGIVSYTTHIQGIGTETSVYDGSVSGTIGQSRRMEAMWISLRDKPTTGGIRYRTHIQGIGWQDWAYDGTMSGTSGQSKRVEAVAIELTGEMANQYDVYYRVSSQTYGWLGWAKNGEESGTTGLSKRLEAIQIMVVPKGTQAPLGSGLSTVISG